jgi:CBS domain containing-hemolysin-like protein
MRLDEVGQQFHMDIEHEEVDSVSGLVLTRLGRIPQTGDSVRYERLIFEVISVKGHGVDECAVWMGDEGAGSQAR